MSRSRQAASLARHLSTVTGTTVDLAHDTGTWWTLRWTDGPTDKEMRRHLKAALADDRYAEMRDREVEFLRAISPRAWAARAVASLREGTLAAAVTTHAAHQRALSVQVPRARVADPYRTHEHYALWRHIGELCATTAYPQRASMPEDETHIQQVLAAGTQRHPDTGRTTLNQHDMAQALLAALTAEHTPAVNQPPRLTVVRTPQDSR
ncbi:hypothetical protein GCM10027168_11750 [Streptomyces capparidis]